MDVLEVIALAGKVMLGAAAAVSLWFMARGIMDMQRVNAADPEVMELLEHIFHKEEIQKLVHRMKINHDSKLRRAKEG